MRGGKNEGGLKSRRGTEERREGTTEVRREGEVKEGSDNRGEKGRRGQRQELSEHPIP